MSRAEDGRSLPGRRSLVPPGAPVRTRRGASRRGPRRRIARWAAFVAAGLLLAVAHGQHHAYHPLWTGGDGTAVAWLYPADGLLLAVGEAEVTGANPAQARRAAVLDAQRHVIQAFAVLHGVAGGRLEGVIRHGRVALVEAEGRRVRVFYVTRLTDIELR